MGIEGSIMDDIERKTTNLVRTFAKNESRMDIFRKTKERTNNTRIRKAVRNLAEARWNNRRERQLGIGQRRETFIFETIYIYIYIYI